MTSKQRDISLTGRAARLESQLQHAAGKAAEWRAKADLAQAKLEALRREAKALAETP